MTDSPRTFVVNGRATPRPDEPVVAVPMAATDDQRMLQSGLAPLDEALGGVLPARIHLLTGALGTGKTAACLQFIAAALRAGESAAMVTADRGSDLRALAIYLGIDLDSPLRNGQLQLLRYRPQFARALEVSRSPERALADLRGMLVTAAPTRIAIDPLDPFLGDGGPVNAGSLALVNFLDELGATSLLTHSSEPTGSFDRRLDPIIGRSVAVVRLERGRDDLHYLRLLRSRVSDVPVAPIAFEIRRDGGIKMQQRIQQRSNDDSTPSRLPRRLLVLHTGETASTEIVDLLDRDYETVVRRAPAPYEPLEIATEEIDGIVMSITHDTVDSALALASRLNEQPDVPPIVVAARFNLRSMDRAHLLRRGADETLASDMTPPEFLQRLAAALSRSHLAPLRTAPAYSDAVIVQPWQGFAYKPLSRDEFASALASHVSRDNPTQYTVVTFTPTHDDVNGVAAYVPLRQLSDAVMRATRVKSGDLTAVIDNCVAVYLHGAQQDQAAAFADRVKRVWSGKHRASLKVESFPYPSGEPKLRTMFEASAP
jgi:KaiC/GvpD/RAD55 family RecA-like ATPase/DNA-binding response OmpR family regulator